jgi:hypothetical protein
MEHEILAISLNLLSVPFGLMALYYGIRGYRATEGGLKAYTYFLLAVLSYGVFMLMDLFRLLGIFPLWADLLMEVFHLLTAVAMFLAFRYLYRFISLSR